MGLNDSFTGIRGQILLIKPLPTFSQSYAILLEEENQREAYDSLQISPTNLAMSIKPYFAIKSQNKDLSTSSKKSGDSSVVCDYCHMSGHLRDKCYYIHGYPTWHKLFGKPKPKPRFLKERNSVVANVTTLDNAGSAETNIAVTSQVQSDNLNLSEGQCRQIIQMLQKNMAELQYFSPSSSGSWSTQSSVNMAQMSGPCLDEGSRNW